MKAYNKDTKSLEKLKEELYNKLKIYKKEEYRNKSIRNLKIFKSTLKLTSPILVCAGITVGGFMLAECGLPFYLDSAKKYKVYEYEGDSNGYINKAIEYKRSVNGLNDNSLLIYTPWEVDNGKFVRYKEEYNLKGNINKEVYDAIIEENYTYIFNNLEIDNSEKIIANEINIFEGNDYYFKASLCYLDEDDYLIFKEPVLTNNIITFSEMFIISAVGIICIKSNRKNYFDELNVIINDYKKLKNKREIKKISNEIKVLDNKIKILKKSGENNK